MRMIKFDPVSRDKKKKALLVANLAGFGSFLLSDIDILQELGYEVSFVANGNKHGWDSTRQELEERKVSFYQMDFDTKNPFTKMNFIAYRQLCAILKNEQFDLIHCHTPIAGLAARLAAAKYRKKGTKVIYTTHGFAFTSHSSKKSRFLYRMVESIGSFFSDAIITINREDYRNAKKMHCKRVFYIPGVGVHTAQYQDVDVDRWEYRHKLGIKDDEIMILSVGELSERKNHRIIIEALSTIQEKEKYVYVICGHGVDGGTGETLKKLAKEKNVSLFLLGFRTDIPQITKCSDIGALPSLREGLGLAGIQSLAAGIPVVGTDVQGIRDYIINEETGYLCQPNHVKEFAEAISRLSDLNKRDRMKEACMKMAKRFDMTVSEKQRKAIYQKVLD